MNTEKESSWRGTSHDVLKYKKIKKKNSTTHIGMVLGIILMASVGGLGVVNGQEILVEDFPIVEYNNLEIATSSLESIIDASREVVPTRITFGSSSDRQPSWSPDSKNIVFMTRSAGWQIKKIRLSDLSTTTLAGGAGGIEPAWSPSGTKIAFSRGISDPTMDVYVMNSDGSGTQKLTTIQGYDEYPDWNRDATKIAYVSQLGNIYGPKYISVMNADGSNNRGLRIVGIQPSWKSDGTKIAFKCYSGGANICVMNNDGSNLVRVTSESTNTHEPDWSPDGRYITYASKRDGDWEIFIMNSDGSNKRQLTSNSVEDNYPSWSPDGRYIAYSSFSSGNEDIWIMQVDYSGGPGPTPVPTIVPTPTPIPTPPPPTTNLAPNPGYEVDIEGNLNPDHWYTNVYGGSATKISFAWAKDYIYAGTRSAKITSTDSYGKARWITNRNIAVIPGRNYNLGGYVKTSSAGKAYICATFWNNALSYISGACTGSKSGTNNWNLLQGNVVAPIGAAYTRIETRLEGTGTVWYDDMVFKTI